MLNLFRIVTIDILVRYREVNLLHNPFCESFDGIIKHGHDLDGILLTTSENRNFMNFHLDGRLLNFGIFDLRNLFISIVPRAVEHSTREARVSPRPNSSIKFA